MQHKPHFLGWTRDLAGAVAAQLLPADAARPWSLADTAVIVPTAQAGRRLRRALAARADAHATGVLTGPVVTPFRLFDLVPAPRPLADGWAQQAAWLRVLDPARCHALPGLFPRPPDRPDTAWRIKAVEQLCTVRAQLAEAGCSPAEVARHPDIHAAEAARWRELAALEDDVVGRLAEAGLEDPVARQRAAVGTLAPPPGVRRIVLAACPDLAPLVIRLLARWSEQIAVTVLIHAPDALADRFDAWGVPSPAAWGTALDLALDPATVRVDVVETPRDQAEAVERLLRARPDDAAAGRFAIGVPDASVTPFVVRRLEALNCPSYDPSGVPYRHHPILRGLEAWAALATAPTYLALRTWLRQAPALREVEAALGAKGSDLLEELDAVQNACLPATLEEVIDHVARHPSGLERVARLGEWLRKQLGERDPLSTPALLERLTALHRDARLVPGRPEDDAFIEVARFVVDGLQRIEECRALAPAITAGEWIDLLLQSAEGHAYQPSARRDAVQLEGWLELAWTGAAVIAVTGMNEGVVPGGRTDDLFLPDTLRVALGLRGDADRLARDLYLLTALAESRRDGGLLGLIAGRRTSSGDVLKPSRLFWCCDDETLIERAELFFQTPVPVSRVPERSFALTLDTTPPDERARRRAAAMRWSVTDFSAYLQCPYRFYLRRVLQMEAVDDAKEELDELDFGHLVHAALEDFGRDEAVWAMRDARAMGDRLAELVRGHVKDRYGPRPPLIVDLQATSAEQRLRAFARVQVEELAAGWRIAEVERRCEVDLAGAVVVGKIDRIDRHPDGRIRVFDYKTSDSVQKTPAAIHLAPPRAEDPRPYVAVDAVTGNRKTPGPRHWSDLQLPLYAHFVRTLIDAEAPLAVGYVQLAKAVGDIGITMWDQLDPRLITSAVACAEGVIRDAQAGRYGPPLGTRYPDDLDALWWEDFEQQVPPPRITGVAR